MQARSTRQRIALRRLLKGICSAVSGSHRRDDGQLAFRNPHFSWHFGTDAKDGVLLVEAVPQQLAEALHQLMAALVVHSQEKRSTVAVSVVTRDGSSATRQNSTSFWPYSSPS